MTKKIYYIFTLIGSLLLSSCDSYLDIQPVGQVIPNTLAEYRALFTTAYNTALNDRGICEIRTDIATILQSDATSKNSLGDVEKWNDVNPNASTRQFGWAAYYTNIYYANAIIDKKDEISEGSQEDINQLVGEAYLMRAYMHFILVNLYGQPYTAAGALETKAVPLKLNTDLEEIPSRNTVKEIYTSILSDIETARKLINKKEWEVQYSYRFSTLSVDAMESRVYLWEGSKESIDKALNATEEIITAIGDNGIVMDDMYTYSYLLPEISQSNRSLASEALFSLNVSDVTSKITSYIIPNFVNTDYTAMYISPTDVENIYEGINSDVRFTLMLDQTQSDSRGYVPMKIHQASLDEFNKNRLSLIRLPEIFYIAAECYATSATPNLDMALQRLNKIRENRGISTPLENLNADQIIKEIQKEYHKEFISEGVMFYYYKRTGCKSIPNYSEEMTDTQYLLPYPTFEIQSGRVQ